jgi:hypothetical protein
MDGRSCAILTGIAGHGQFTTQASPAPRPGMSPVTEPDFAPTTRSAYVTNYLGYLDPGSGTLLLQGLVAGVASALVMAKVYWRRAKRLLGFRSETAEPNEE